MLLLTQSYNSSLSICIFNETIELPYLQVIVIKRNFIYTKQCVESQKTCYHIMWAHSTKMRSHCLFAVVDKSGTSCYQLVTRLMRPTDSQQVVSTSLISSACKAGFPLGAIFRAERKFSLSFLISSTREITRQRKFRSAREFSPRRMQLRQ
jgi:hypothetical protein